MKKMMSLLLVLMMVFSLVGCGNQAKEDSASQNAEATKAPTAAPTQGSTEQGNESAAQSSGEIYNMVMEIVNYGYDDKDIQMVEDEVNKITEASIGVHVSFLTVPIADMGTKLELMVAGGEQMDLVQTGLLTTPNNLSTEGLLLPLTNYLTDNLKNMAGDLLKASTVNGEVYAYPGNLYPGAVVSLLYDTDLAKQYNIQVPERITSNEDMDKIFDQVKQSGMSQYAISLGDGVNSEWNNGVDYDDMGDSAYLSYGVVMGNDTTNTVVDWYESDAYKQQLAVRRAWFEKGYAVPDSISNGYTTHDSMSQGTVFSFITTVGTGASVAYWSAQTGKKLAAIPITDVKITGSGTINLSWGISSNCTNPKKVVEFLELLYTNSELSNLISYGVEGTHYVTREGSRIIQYPEGTDATSVGYGSFIGPFGDSTKIYYREPLTDDFVKSIDNYGLAKAKVSRYLGYTFDTAPVQSELTAVNAVISQYGPSLACGIVDPAKTLPEFQDALKKAGMDKVVAENQKQLNAWLGK